MRDQEATNSLLLMDFNSLLLWNHIKNTSNVSTCGKEKECD